MFKKHKQAGFTIIEMMVVVSIIGLLSSITILNYNSVGRKSVVAMAAQNLASDVRKAQSYALNGKIVGSNKGSWGIYFNQDVDNRNSYRLFTDFNNDYKRDPNEDFQIIKLPKNVVIDFISTSYSQSSVVYIPPDPKINITINDTIQANVITIVLKDVDNIASSTVIINDFGLVDVQ